MYVCIIINIVIRKAAAYETEITNNPVYEAIISKDNELGTDNQVQKNPSCGEIHVKWNCNYAK